MEGVFGETESETGEDGDPYPKDLILSFNTLNHKCRISVYPTQIRNGPVDGRYTQTTTLSLLPKDVKSQEGVDV